jgi:hypothetical protein
VVSGLATSMKFSLEGSNSQEKMTEDISAAKIA